MDNPRPTWLRDEPCPAWCAREHEEDDHEDDQFHASEPSFVPAIAAVADTVPVTASARSVDLVVYLSRRVGELVEWIIIESSRTRSPRLVVSRESAHALATALDEQLTEADDA